MKVTVFVLLAVASLGGCGERVSSPATQAQAPEFAPPVKRAAAIASSAPIYPAPLDEPSPKSAPDYKDSAGYLDRSK